MADALALDVRASFAWLYTDTLDLTTLADASKLEYVAAFADGVGAGQADKLWHASRTLAAGASEQLVLSALAYPLFGGSVTLALARVKGLLLANTSTTAGDDLLLGGAAATEWSAPFAAPGDRLRVPADSCLLWTNRRTGWNVAPGTADTLQIQNVGAGTVAYKLALFGTSS